VLAVLGDLGIIESSGEGHPPDSKIPILEVWNKWDALPAERRVELEQVAGSDDSVVAISALTGEGVDDLLARVGSMLTESAKLVELTIPANDGRRLAWLHAHGEVIEDRQEGEHHRLLRVRLGTKQLGQFSAL
jgi:GTPase